MKKLFLSVIFYLIINDTIKAQFGVPAYPLGSPGAVNMWTLPDVRSVGIGKFSLLPAADRTRARLHVRNDLCKDPYLALNGHLFRTDGNTLKDNIWEMHTGSAGVYNEIFRLSVPQSMPNTFLLQSSSSSGDIRFNTGGANFRAIITSVGAVGINTLTPGNRLEIASTSSDPTPSGLRFHNLTSSSPLVSNTGPGVLAVNQFGDVIYVPAPSGSSSICAKNGLNTIIGNPCVELGGTLLHYTNIDLNNFNMSWYNKGQHAITDYLSGTNSTTYPLNTLSGDYKSGVFDNAYPKALRVDNVRTPQNATNIGVEVNVDMDNTSGNYGEGVTVIGDGNVNYGISLNVRPRTPGAANSSSSPLGYAIGVNSYANDASHSLGGVFSATTPVNVIPSEAVGVQGIGGGGFEAYGGLFYAYGSPHINIATYGIARNISGPSIPSKRVGVWGLSDDQTNLGDKNVGTTGIAENGTSNPSSTSVGLFGVCGNNSWGLNYIPTGLRAGVYGNSGTGNWAAYFDGNVNVNGLLTQNLIPVVVSDQSIKKNLKQIENALTIINKLKPKSYDLSNENCKQMNFKGAKTQFGLIAQEVEKVIPDIVYEVTIPATTGEDGKISNEAKTLKGVSYDQLISLLIKGTQEQQDQLANQQKQIDELKALVKSSSNGNDTKLSNAQAITLSDNNAIVLNQNVPNPFAESTVITYNIPTDFTKAQLIFSTNEGKIIKVVDVKEKGQGTLNVFANDLSSGLYSYSLVVDGKTIDTKKMVKN